MSLFFNKNPAGKIGNIVFGLCSIADGVVMVLSLGFLKTTFTLDCARSQARKQFTKLKRSRNELA